MNLGQVGPGLGLLRHRNFSSNRSSLSTSSTFKCPLKPRAHSRNVAAGQAIRQTIAQENVDCSIKSNKSNSTSRIGPATCSVRSGRDPPKESVGQGRGLLSWSPAFCYLTFPLRKSPSSIMSLPVIELPIIAMSKPETLKIGGDQCDLDLFVNGLQFRVHGAVLMQESDLIRSWASSPLICQKRDQPVAISLQLPEIRIPSHFNPARGEIDPMHVFKQFMDLSYCHYHCSSYTLRLCYNHGLSAICHAKGYDSFQFATLAVLADFLCSPKLKEACDVYLSFMGRYDVEQLRFARKYSLTRLFYKTIRTLIVNDPINLESSSEASLEDITDALLKRDLWYRDQCFRFPYLVRQAAQFSIPLLVFERKVNDDDHFKISFTNIERLKLLLNWCEICKEIWDPLEMFSYSRAIAILKKISVSECTMNIKEAKLLLQKIEKIICDARHHRKEIDRALVKLEFWINVYLCKSTQKKKWKYLTRIYILMELSEIGNSAGLRPESSPQ